MDTPDILIWVVEKELTDGSSVFNVDFNGTILEAIDQGAAETLAQAIVDAINENTNTTADVMMG